MEGCAVADINKRLLQFFTEHYKPGAIGLVGTEDTIGMAISEATEGGDLWLQRLALGALFHLW